MKVLRLREFQKGTKREYISLKRTLGSMPLERTLKGTEDA